MPILASELARIPSPSLMPLFSSSLTQTTSTSSQASSMPSSSRQLSNESFSFGWLAGDEPHFEVVAPPAGGPDVDMVVSRHRSSTSDAYDFDFGLVSRPLSPLLAHADQIFSNGFLLPLHAVVDQSKRESTSTDSSSAAGSFSSSTLSRSLSLDSSESYLSFSNRYNQLHHYSCNAIEGFPNSSTGPATTTTKNKLPSLAKKYLCFLLPAWSKKACRRRSWWRLLGSKTKTTTERSTPPPPPPKTSVHHSCRGAGNSRVVDSSYESTAIDDAILHCKKSVVSST